MITAEYLKRHEIPLGLTPVPGKCIPMFSDTNAHYGNRQITESTTPGFEDLWNQVICTWFHTFNAMVQLSAEQVTIMFNQYREQMIQSLKLNPLVADEIYRRLQNSFAMHKHAQVTDKQRVTLNIIVDEIAKELGQTNVNLIQNDLLQGHVGHARAFCSLYGDNIRVFAADGSDFPLYIWDEKTALWHARAQPFLWTEIATHMQTVIGSLVSTIERRLFNGKERTRADILKDLKETHDPVKLKWFSVWKELYKWWIKSKETSYTKNISVHAQVFLYHVDPKFAENLDKNPDLLPVQKRQVVDLRNYTARDRRKDDYFTFECPVLWNLTANTNIIAQFIDDMMIGNKVMIEFLQRFVGYLFTGSVKEKRLFLCWGSGDNAKSTFMLLIKGVLGPLYTTVDDAVFIKGTTNKGGSASHHMLDLRGRRVAVMPELEKGTHIGAKTIKGVTGNDPIKARGLYDGYVEFLPTIKPIMPTNELPIIPGGKAMWNRVVLIGFPAEFVKEEDITTKTVLKPHQRRADKNMIDLLMSETNKSAFLLWAVRGAQIWYADGLQVPDQVKNDTHKYQVNQDLIMEFLSEICVFGEGQQQAGKFNKAFKMWWRAHIDDQDTKVPISDKDFGMAMKVKFGDPVKTNGGVLHYQNVYVDLVKLFMKCKCLVDDPDETVTFANLWSSFDAWVKKDLISPSSLAKQKETLQTQMKAMLVIDHGIEGKPDTYQGIHLRPEELFVPNI